MNDLQPSELELYSVI